MSVFARLSTLLLSMLLATSCLFGCSSSASSEEQSQDAQAAQVSLENVTDDDLNDAFYLMAETIPVDIPIASLYISGDSDSKQISANFTTEEDGTDARALADDAEALCAQYSLAVAKAALARVSAQEDANEDEIAQWQAIVDAEQAIVDSNEGSGGLYDYYSVTAAIQNPSASLSIDGVRDAGADSDWTWQ